MPHRASIPIPDNSQCAGFWQRRRTVYVAGRQFRYLTIADVRVSGGVGAQYASQGVNSDLGVHLNIKFNQRRRASNPILVSA